MTLVRESPSGENFESGDAGVESVFGRTGAVVAESGDYGTDLVEDTSTNDPVTVTLESLVSSDTVSNESSVPGATLSDALDTLLSGTGLGEGTIMDTFQGGTATSLSTSSTAAAIGDLGWNVVTFNGAGAFSVQKLFPDAGVVGAYRMIGPTTSGQGTNVYLGLLTQGLIRLSDLEEFTFRARMAYSGAASSITQLGIMNAANQNLQSPTTIGAGFVLDNDTLGPNYFCIANAGAGPVAVDSGVAGGSVYRNFRIVPRYAEGRFDYYIDGVLVASLTAELPPVSTGVCPFWGTIGGSGAASMDVDNFVLAPN